MSTTVAQENFVIRPAGRSDCAEIFRLIQELADYEKMPNAVKISQEKLEQDGFDSNPPMWRAFVAEVKDEDASKIDGKHKLVGYALYFEFYSLLRGRALWLRDLYVEETWRQHKVGQSLFRNVVRVVGIASYFISYHTFSGYRIFLEQLYVTESFQNKHNIEQNLYEAVVKAGVEMDCAQVDWFCLSWNPARHFYEKLGAINITEKEDWNVYRLNKDTMLQISSK